MASIPRSPTRLAAVIPRLDDQQVLVLARRRLAELAERQRRAPSELQLTRAPRLRRFGRRCWDIGSKLLDLLEVLGRFLVNPRHIPGRWLARMRLLAPTKTFNRWLFGMVLAVGGLAYLTHDRFASVTESGSSTSWSEKAAVAILVSLFGTVSLALLAFLWNDLFRCPYIMRRVCRQVRRRPDCVLLGDIGRRAVKLARREEPVEIVPRTELLDEITPGVLQHKRKDVQIVVGDPGAGKTTALIGIAETLAKLGIVPVLVPLRSTAEADLVELAKDRLRRQVREYVRSEAQFEQFWRWLYVRRRVAILTDDLDRLSPDGERGFALRQALGQVETVDLPIILTARPAGVPAGIAASAIDLGGLDEQRAVECVAKGARNDPSFRASQEVSSESLLRWIRAGRLTEVPYYLELLAQLAAGGRDAFLELPEPWNATIEMDQTGLCDTQPDGSASWNPWWVHFLLLDRFYREVCSGNVARWRGIEPHERRCAMHALQDAALGVLLSQAVAARVGVEPRAERERDKPERTALEDFIRTDDRDKRDNGRVVRATTDSPLVGAPAAERGPAAGDRRPGISAHEVIDTAERLRILDRDAENNPQFRHRITQAYLAGRRLAEIEVARDTAVGDAERDWIGLLLDHRHPEKLTAHTALTFAALWADRMRRNAKQSGVHQGGRSEEEWALVGQRILRRLVDGAADSLRLFEPTAEEQPAQSSATVVAVTTEEARRSSTLAIAIPEPRDDHRSRGQDDLDPRHARDPEDRRDPDDALIKLTTAADIAHAIACSAEPGPDGRCPTPPEELRPPARRRRHREGDRITQCEILGLVRASGLVTRWTKLNAIKAIAALEAEDRWRRIWAFARDSDYAVRQAASAALERDAYAAYRALEDDIEKLIVRAAALSALDRSLEQETADGGAEALLNRDYDVGLWTRDDVLGLQALGTVLPAIVSGLQEDPAAARTPAAWRGRDGNAPEEWRGRDGNAPEEWRRWSSGDGNGRVAPPPRELYVRGARAALDHLVALAFQGDHHALERMVAQGFRGDAMRHAGGEAEGTRGEDRSHAGPGWVAAHSRLVVTVGLCQAEHWYAQLVLGQALALYTIAGAGRQATYDVLARCLHRGGAHRHPFTQRALRLARSAVRRHGVHSSRWRTFIWDDEVSASNKRPVKLTDRTAQLLGDVTVLLDLSVDAQEDRVEASAHMDELPHCLHRSRDRREILGTGCPPECGWNLCPYKQPPPEEPNEHHGVSRAFCRRQRWIARRHGRPPWQRRIGGRRLAAFWQEMERRARI